MSVTASDLQALFDASNREKGLLGINPSELLDEMVCELEDETAAYDQPDEEWLPDWYMRTIALADAELDVLKRQYERRKRAVEARKAALAYRWGQRFVDCVRRLTPPKRKSIETAYGRAGFRISKPRVEVMDPEATVRWILETGDPELLDALPAPSVRATTPLLEWVKAHTTVDENGEERIETPPGCRYKAPEERFYPSTFLPQQFYEATQ